MCNQYTSGSTVFLRASRGRSLSFTRTRPWACPVPRPHPIATSSHTPSSHPRVLAPVDGVLARPAIVEGRRGGMHEGESDGGDGCLCDSLRRVPAAAHAEADGGDDGRPDDGGELGEGRGWGGVGEYSRAVRRSSITSYTGTVYTFRNVVHNHCQHGTTGSHALHSTDKVV